MAGLKHARDHVEHFCAPMLREHGLRVPFRKPAPAGLEHIICEASKCALRSSLQQHTWRARRARRASGMTGDTAVCTMHKRAPPSSIGPASISSATSICSSLISSTRPSNSKSPSSGSGGGKAKPPSATPARRSNAIVPSAKAGHAVQNVREK